MNGDALVTLGERPELRGRLDAIHRKAWPVFLWLGHNAAAERYWTSLFDTFAGFQGAVVAGGAPVAAFNSVPLAWDGTVAGLPAGWDAALERAFADHRADRSPTVLCALSAVIDPAHRGRGLAGTAVGAIYELARRRGLGRWIVPVRPTGKHREPEVAIEEYLARRRDDGLPADPWLRAHARAGGEVLGVAGRSMVYTGSVGEWELWTRRRFPESGSYPIEHGLVPLEVDREADRGVYAEPNVWVLHRV